MSHFVVCSYCYCYCFCSRFLIFFLQAFVVISLPIGHQLVPRFIWPNYYLRSIFSLGSIRVLCVCARARACVCAGGVVARVISEQRVLEEKRTRVSRSGRLVILLSVECASRSRPALSVSRNSEGTIFPTARLSAAIPSAQSRMLCACRVVALVVEFIVRRLSFVPCSGALSQRAGTLVLRLWLHLMLLLLLSILLSVSFSGFVNMYVIYLVLYSYCLDFLVRSASRSSLSPNETCFCYALPQRVNEKFCSSNEFRS